MYQTILRNVYGGMAIGANGERLQFIGNFPAKAGDSVWTDGNIIFGHIPQKASSIPYIPIAKSGIPVLLDDRQGYFSTGGSWVDFPIAQYDWIVNNQKVFFGGAKEEDYQLTLDAAVSDSNDILTVKWYPYYRWIINSRYAYWFADGEKIKIYQNQDLLTEISLLPFLQEIDDFTNACFDRIKRMSPWREMGGSHVCGFILEIQSLDIDRGDNVSFVVFGSVLADLRVTRNYDGTWNSRTCDIPAMLSFRYKVSGDNKELINYHICGGECGGASLNLDTQLIENDLILQVDDGFCRLDKYGRISFYDSELNIIAENIVVDNDFCYVEVDHFQPTEYDRTGYDVFYNAKPYYKIFTPDGNTKEEYEELIDAPLGYTKYFGGGTPQEVPILDGYFIKDSDGYLSPFYFKPLLKRIDNGNYLFGTYSGKLYIKTKNTIQEVGSGLKNFTLEVLNDISKAKAKG